MYTHERDPRLDLYTATGAAFQRIATEIEPSDNNILLPLQGVTPMRDFLEVGSTFEIDCATVNAIVREEGSFVINILSTRNNQPYARHTDLTGPKAEIVSTYTDFQPHVLIIPAEGPVALTHESYYSDIDVQTRILKKLVEAGYAEQIGAGRAQSLIQCLGSINIKHLNSAEFGDI